MTTYTDEIYVLKKQLEATRLENIQLRNGIGLDYTNQALNENISHNMILGLKLNRLECDGILSNNYRNAPGSKMTDDEWFNFIKNFNNITQNKNTKLLNNDTDFIDPTIIINELFLKIR